MQQHKHHIKTTPQFVSMAEYSYICTIRPTFRARHIGESVALLSFPGNLVNSIWMGINMTLTTWYFRAARIGCRKYTSVGLLFVTSKGFTRTARDSKRPAPHFRFTNLLNFIGAKERGENNILIYGME